MKAKLNMDFAFIDTCNKDIISYNLITKGEFKSDFNEVCQKLIKENTSVLDIGANLGSFCIPLAKEFSSCTFHSFEPQKMKYYQLCGNAYINNLNNITAHRIALIDSSYKKELIFNNNNSCLQKHGKSKETVPCCCLDDLKINNISFIKLDVEYCKLDILKGGEKTLKRNNYPYIVFEILDTPWMFRLQKDLFNYLENIGYNIKSIGKYEYLAHGKHIDQCNLSNIYLD